MREGELHTQTHTHNSERGGDGGVGGFGRSAEGVGEIKKDKETDRQKTDRRTDGQTDRQTDRQ